MALPLRYNTRALAFILNISTSSSAIQLSPTTRKKSQKSNLELPKYKEIKYISYADFLQKIRELNPDVELNQQKDLHEALKATIVQAIGWKEFSRIKVTYRDGRESKLHKSTDTLESYHAWHRLVREEKTYFETGSTERTERISENSLRLPRYTSVDEIDYRRFLEKLRELNPKNSNIGPSHVRAALKKVVIGILGEKDFNRATTSNAVGKHGIAWRRLQQEAVEYRASRGRSWYQLGHGGRFHSIVVV